MIEDMYYLQPLPGETVTPLEPKYRVTMLGRRPEACADAGAVAALEEAAAAARLFGQVEAAVAGTSRQCTAENGPEPGKQPTYTYFAFLKWIEHYPHHSPSSDPSAMLHS